MTYAEFHLLSIIAAIVILWIGPRYNPSLKCNLKDGDVTQGLIICMLFIPWIVTVCAIWEGIDARTKGKEITDEQIDTSETETSS